MVGSHEFSALIRELHRELRQRQTASNGGNAADVRWRADAQELALRRLSAPRDFLDWAKRDRHWSFTLAEVMRESHSGPSELAARLLVAILEELEEERQLRDDELALEEAAPRVAACAE
jgi:hypothetical protein